MALDDSTNFAKKYLHHVASSSTSPIDKITVVGVGQVGMACAFSILTQGVSSHICLVDQDADKLTGELMDLQHGSGLLNNANIKASTTYEITANSKICIIAAGVRQRIGESRLNLVQRNTDIFKKIIPEVIKYSPDTIILVVSNPVDILTYVCWKLSGLPKHRVIGSGTFLDSSRFRFLIAQKLNVAPTSIHGYIIGEHGDSSVPLWSSVNVGGVPFKDVTSQTQKESNANQTQSIHKQVVDSAYEIIRLKGYTSWAIGLCVSHICEVIFRDARSINVLSTHVQGFHGIKEDVYLSLPVVLSKDGVNQVLLQPITEEERACLQKSAETINNIQKDIEF